MKSMTRDELVMKLLKEVPPSAEFVFSVDEDNQEGLLVREGS